MNRNWFRRNRFLLILSLALVVVVGIGSVWYSNSLRGPDPVAAPPTVRLISADQYAGLIHEVFGSDVRVSLYVPPPRRIQGLLSLGASDAKITPTAMERFEREARLVSEQVMAAERRQLFMPCSPERTDAADNLCAGEFIAHVGRLLWRRPLNEAEIDYQVAIAGRATEALGDFYAGLEYSLAALMTSPKFLFIIENVEPASGLFGNGEQLDAYSKATRLSLFLWNALPDEELLNAAESGALNSRKGLREQVDRLIASPRLENGVRSFFEDWLHFDEFNTLAKDPVIYPEFSPAIADSAREQTLQTVADYLVRRKEDYRGLFTSQSSLLDDALAAYYGVPVAEPGAWSMHKFSNDRPSAGILTDVAYLALHAHAGRTSPTLRGAALREIFLCQKVPNAPPNVDFSLFEDPDADFKSARERLDAHNTDPVCAGCHKLTDPMGLGLEQFDGAAKFRTTENGLELDVSGSLDGIDFTDPTGLGQAVHDNPALTSCLVTRVFSGAIGRELGTEDREWLAYIEEKFAASGYKFPNLLRDIALSEAFFAVSSPEEETS